MRFERLFWVIFWRAKLKLWGSVSISVRSLVTKVGLGWGMNTGAGKAPRGVMRAAEEGIDSACSRADIEADDRAGGVMYVCEGGGGGAGIEEVLDPEEVVQAVWDLGFVSMVEGCRIKRGRYKQQDTVYQVGG